MEIYLIITIIAIIVMTVLGFFVGSRGKKGLIHVTADGYEVLKVSE